MRPSGWLRASPMTAAFGEVEAPMVAMLRLTCLTDKITPNANSIDLV